MTDVLFKISFITFSISLIFLAFLFYSYEPELISITEIKKKEIEYFQFNAKILTVTETDKVAFITLGDYCELKTVLFKDENISFKEYIDRNILAKGHIIENETYVLDSFKVLGFD